SSLGCVRSQQGGAPAPERNVGCRARITGYSLPVGRPRRHGYAASCRGCSRCRSKHAEGSCCRRTRALGSHRRRIARTRPSVGARWLWPSDGVRRLQPSGIIAMIAAHQPIQRPPQARVLVVDACGHLTQAPRRQLLDFLRPGDLVVANDAATLPASLNGKHVKRSEPIEVRLAARRSLALEDVKEFWAVVFGAGDFHTPTERRPAPPPMSPGDRLVLGSLSATVVRLLGHPRLIALSFDGSPHEIWSGIARDGKPIQYAHINSALALWDGWTVIAGPPVAFEPPSAGFALDWQMLVAMRAKGIEFATLTHAAGLSSTGDESLDARLPFDAPYVIPETTATAISHAHARGGRVVAIGTTVVRALEHAALPDGLVRAGPGLATSR